MNKLKKDMLLINKHGESFKYVGEGKNAFKTRRRKTNSLLHINFNQNK